MSEHVLQYGAGMEGFGPRFGIPDRPPHWSCSCGEWSMTITSLRGPQRAKAVRLHGQHATHGGEPR